MKNRYTVVDADGHVNDSIEDIRARLPQQWRRQGSLGGYSSWNHFLNGTLGPPDQPVTGVQQLAGLDEDAIDVMVMYPTATMGVGLVPETGFASALARAYNEWMYDFCAADPARLQYVALIAPQSVPDAVAELRRAVTELGAVGAMMPSHVHHRPDFGDPHYDPIYAEAQRLDVGLGFHPNTQSLAATLFHNFVNVHALSFPVEHFLTLSATIVGGVFERFPELRVAYLESGIGWVPYLMHRLDRALELQGAAEAPHLTRKATETIRSGRLFFGTECEERTIADAVAWGLEDTLIFASDYPHWDADWPHTVRAVQERSDLTDTVKRKFLHDNALRFYGTPLRARMGAALVAATV